jgi:hypothetical protein
MFKSPPMALESVKLAVPAVPSVMFPFTVREAVMLFNVSPQPSDILKFPAQTLAVAVPPLAERSTVVPEFI